MPPVCSVKVWMEPSFLESIFPYNSEFIFLSHWNCRELVRISSNPRTGALTLSSNDTCHWHLWCMWCPLNGLVFLSKDAPEKVLCPEKPSLRGQQVKHQRVQKRWVTWLWLHDGLFGLLVDVQIGILQGNGTSKAPEFDSGLMPPSCDPFLRFEKQLVEEQAKASCGYYMVVGMCHQW